MKTIQINSIPLKEVIQDLAKIFDTECLQDCDEYSLQVPAKWGKGSIKGVNFSNGLGLIRYHCTFFNDLEIQFVLSKIHPLKFLYCLEGELKHRFEKSKNKHHIEQYQHSIIASKGTSGHVIQFTKEVESTICSVEIDRKKFMRKMKCPIEKSEPKLKNLFKDETAKHEFYHNGMYSLQIAELFEELNGTDHGDLIKTLFIKAKTIDVLTAQLIQFEDDGKQDLHRRILKKTEVKSIAEAVTIIESELDNLDTIQQIAKRVGVNGNKLQDGFQRLFKSTVNEYITKKRLELAKHLLLSTDATMQEISDRVGLKSQSYFSKLFKDKYGITPSDFKQNHSAKTKPSH